MFGIHEKEMNMNSFPAERMPVPMPDVIAPGHTIPGYCCMTRWVPEMAEHIFIGCDEKL